jgi:6,7-dimethyl-8-ribityllumazine synthase
MLKRIRTSAVRAAGGRFVIVASQYNARYVDAMLKAAQVELKRAGAAEVEVIRVPGAFEIPIIAAHLARTTAQGRSSKATGVSAIICLGVILRGETTHASHIGENVSRALMDIQTEYEVPVIHEVLLLENEQQAKARCLDKNHNRGTEAAQTAVTMASVMKKASKSRL